MFSTLFSLSSQRHPTLLRFRHELVALDPPEGLYAGRTCTQVHNRCGDPQSRVSSISRRSFQYFRRYRGEMSLTQHRLAGNPRQYLGRERCTSHMPTLVIVENRCKTASQNHLRTTNGEMALMSHIENGTLKPLQRGRASAKVAAAATDPRKRKQPESQGSPESRSQPLAQKATLSSRPKPTRRTQQTTDSPERETQLQAPSKEAVAGLLVLAERYGL
jgi:hypothetical protein